MVEEHSIKRGSSKETKLENLTVGDSMRPKQITKILTDILMTIILLLLMAYSLVGEAAHEWLGIGIFALFVLHHVLNSRWRRNLRKGKNTPYHILQTALVVMALVSMLSSIMP